MIHSGSRRTASPRVPGESPELHKGPRLQWLGCDRGASARAGPTSGVRDGQCRAGGWRRPGHCRRGPRRRGCGRSAARTVPSGAVDLSPEAWSAIGTGIAAIVAVLAAVVAAWQAVLAKGARDATREQATIAREALELVRAQQHQADAPTSALAIEPPGADQQCWVKVTMTGGPPGVRVGISYVNGWISRVGDDEFRKTKIPGGTTHRRNMIKNATAAFRHEASADAVAIWSMVIINSTDFDSDERRWEHVERVDWRDPASPFS